MKTIIVILILSAFLRLEAAADYSVEFLPSATSERTVSTVTSHALILLKLSPAKEIAGNTAKTSTSDYLIIERIFNPGLLTKGEILQAYNKPGNYFVKGRSSERQPEYSGFMQLRVSKIIDISAQTYNYDSRTKTVRVSKIINVRGITTTRFDYYNLCLLILSAGYSILLFIVLFSKTLKDIISLRPSSKCLINLKYKASGTFRKYKSILLKKPVITVYTFVCILGIITAVQPSLLGEIILAIALTPLLLILFEIIIVS